MPRKSKTPELLAENDGAPASVRMDSDPFERLEADLAADVDIWEAAVSLGIAISDNMDDQRWKLARLASMIGKRYGEDRLGEFSSEVNESAKKLGEWRQVFTYYGKEMLARMREYPILRYTHFRVAMRLGENQESMKVAVDFLEECVNESWRAGKAEMEAAQRMGKTVSPPKLGEGTASVYGITRNRVTLVINNEELRGALANLQLESKTLLMRVYADLLASVSEKAAGEATGFTREPGDDLQDYGTPDKRAVGDGPLPLEAGGAEIAPF